MRGHVILDAWPRELDWELVTSKITDRTDVAISEFGKKNICFLHVFGPRLLKEYIRLVSVLATIDRANFGLGSRQSVKFEDI